MANPVWEAVITYAHFGGANGSSGQNSSSFNIPGQVGTVTLIVPALDGAVETMKVQGLSPLDGTTWTDVKFYEPGGATFDPLALIPESSYITFPATLFGAGTFRFVTSATNQTTASQVVIIYDRI